MIIILSTFIICAAFAYGIENTKDERTYNTLICICLIFLTLVSGTRLVGGLDFESYYGQYESVPTFPNVLNPNNRNPRYEVGYVFIESFFKTLGFSFYGFCLIHALIFYTCLWIGLRRYTKHFGIVILVFLYKLFFYDTMISMRQSLTIAFFFLIIPFIEQKKWLHYYICAFLISRIHNGALLLFALYPLAYIKLTPKFIILLNIIFIPTMALGFMGVDVLGPIGKFLEDNATNEAMEQRTEKYFDNENLSPIGIFHTLEYFLMMGLFLIHIKQFNLNNSKIHTVIWMFLCLLPLFTLLRGSEILTREKDYFTIFYAVIIGYLTDWDLSAKAKYFIATLLICAFGYYRFTLKFDDGAFLLYHSWLFDSDYSIFYQY